MGVSEIKTGGYLEQKRGGVGRLGNGEKTPRISSMVWGQRAGETRNARNHCNHILVTSTDPESDPRAETLIKVCTIDVGTRDPDSSPPPHLSPRGTHTLSKGRRHRRGWVETGGAVCRAGSPGRGPPTHLQGRRAQAPVPAWPVLNGQLPGSGSLPGRAQPPAFLTAAAPSPLHLVFLGFSALASLSSPTSISASLSPSSRGVGGVGLITSLLHLSPRLPQHPVPISILSLLITVGLPVSPPSWPKLSLSPSLSVPSCLPISFSPRHHCPISSSLPTSPYLPLLLGLVMALAV